MRLWLGICLAVAVISENTVFAIGSSELRKTKCDEVLFKIWTIFSNLLDEDGETVKTPSRDHVQYALTLIKKSILENEDNENNNAEKLLLREAELAKHKVYLHDSRSLQELLDQEVTPYENSNVMFKYEHQISDKPSCREAFRNLLQATQEGYNNLANSPICTEGTIDMQTSQSDNYYPGSFHQMIQLNRIKDFTRIRHNQNQVPIANANVNNIDMIQIPQNTIGQESSINTNYLLHAARITKAKHLLESDFNADLDHAKDVANKINKLYLTNKPLRQQISHKPIRDFNTNFVSVSSGVVNNPVVASLHHNPNINQESYLTQSHSNVQNNINRERNLNQQIGDYPNVPPQDIPDETILPQDMPNDEPQQVMPNNIENTYTLITNTVQSPVPRPKYMIMNQKYTNPINTFENSKYQPNPAHVGVITREELVYNNPTSNNEYVDQEPVVPKLKFKLHKHPYQNKEVLNAPQNLPNNIDEFSDTISAKVNQQIPDNRQYNNYNAFVNPSSAKGWGYQQTNTYNSGQNHPNTVLYTNGYSAIISPSRPIYSIGYNNNLKQQKQFVMQKKSNQYYPAYNTNSRPLRYENDANNNNNLVLTQQLSYYNGQPVVDKLADWISGTNSPKLNSDFDAEAEIELTYKVNRKTPMYQPSVFYIKFHMPYKAFTEKFSQFLTMQNSRSASPDSDLYNLASQYNATVERTDSKEIPEEEILSPEGKLLVRARYIPPNVSENDSPNTVDIINLERESELNKDLENSVDKESDAQSQSE